MERVSSQRMLAVAALAFAAVFVWSVFSPGSPTLPPPPGTPGMPRLLQLGADDCMFCQVMAPFLEELKREQQGRIEIVYLDASRNPELLQQYHADGYPVQFFYDAKGRLLLRHDGFIPKDEILATFEKHGVSLAPWRREK
ncbi:MAG: thioredoxin family protein [Armatimonadetes bacterium]|nr:thioredoxin family protein [Armatimonadota bacterium]